MLLANSTKWRTAVDGLQISNPKCCLPAGAGSSAAGAAAAGVGDQEDAPGLKEKVLALAFKPPFWSLILVQLLASVISARCCFC
jgi:hypothetical protein